MLVCPAILFWTLLFGVFGKCYCQFLFSHNLLFWQMLLHFCHFMVDVVLPGQMLKPLLFSGMDVITTCFISCLSEVTCWAVVIAFDFL